jgi:hypothetical protein
MIHIKYPPRTYAQKEDRKETRILHNGCSLKVVLCVFINSSIIFCFVKLSVMSLHYFYNEKETNKR